MGQLTRNLPKLKQRLRRLNLFKKRKHQEKLKIFGRGELMRPQQVRQGLSRSALVPLTSSGFIVNTGGDRRDRKKRGE